MKVNVEDKLYDVRFHKSHREEGEKRVIDTCCVVSIVDPEKTGKERFSEISCDFSYHNPIDRYSKITGKKIALTRAISSFSKSERVSFWKAFHKEFSNSK